MKSKVHCNEVPCNAGVHSEKGVSVDGNILTPNCVLIWPVIHKARPCQGIENVLVDSTALWEAEQ